ncbi:glycosyltransferase [Microbacterium foliorum]|uniref:glycosyltransferase n=1 Tax=Microbacterium foliorum TaxID=104336 RepID=UPI0015E441EA|nr:glycosyltransferase [Microbacterium foliorum]
MSPSPAITIIIPLHNDEEWVADALASCLSQTHTSLEVICVDDASTDGTCAVVEQIQQTDARVRLIRQSTNRTAFQARKLGVEQSQAPYVLFLDGDDRLRHDAAEVTLDLARTSGADLVGFGVDVVSQDGRHPSRFATDLQPVHTELVGDQIVNGLFPIGKVAQGHLWRYLWSTELLRAAYAALDDSLELPRANDIPISFLGAVMAGRYVSTDKKLYQYFWRRGVSGLATGSESAFDFYLGAMDSIDAVGVALEDSRTRVSETGDLDAIYDSARLSMVQVLLRRCEETADPDLQALYLRKLVARVGRVDAVRAASVFFPQALSMLARGETGAFDFSQSAPRVVMLTTGNLDTGGVQGVLVAQAHLLRRAGFDVVVAVQTLGDTAFHLPDSVPVVRWTGRNRAEKIADYLRLCEEYAVDVIIDHHVLYNENWPFFALAARAQGIPTIGWLHNFALRPLYDSTTRSSFLADRLPILANVVVLSKADVAFWKLRGVERVAYLPNPPSPWLESRGVAHDPRHWDGGVLRLVWWGRLQQHTKRVRGLVDVAEELDRRGVDFHLTVIGPDSPDASAEQLRKSVSERELDARVTISGPLHGQDLSDALEHAHVYISLSGIEGYPLTLIEAQALGMPVVMYELPWLAVLDHNAGVSSVAQGDLRALADRVERIASDPGLYSRMSAASLEAATRATGHDFLALYDALLNQRLSASEYSPAPTETDMRMLMDLAIAFSEEGIRRAARVERRAQSRADDLRRQLNRLEKRSRGGAASPARTALQSDSGRRETALEARLRTSIARLKALVSGSACVLGARVQADELVLRLRPPRGRAFRSVQLHREIDGVPIAHNLALADEPDGTVLAKMSVDPLANRRWTVRATAMVSGVESVVSVPIHANAQTRGSRKLKVRFHPGETVQIYSHG